MSHYADQRIISEMTTIRREVLLPDEAIGQVRVLQGQRVDIRDSVARGIIPARHIIIEAAKELRLRNPADLPKKLLKRVGARVQEGEPIAGDDPKRGRRVMSPVRGLIVHVGDGRIIMQSMPRVINLEAGVRGRVIELYPRGVAIEAVGTLIQGIWGNGRSTIATLRLVPHKGGMQGLPKDTLEAGYRNEVVLSPETLTSTHLKIAQVRQFAGLIVPSMPAALIPEALASDVTIMVTEGFGNQRMPEDVLTLFTDCQGYQVTLDGFTPRRNAVRRPEAVVNRPRRDDLPATPDARLPLRPGMRIRVSRAPYQGQLGRILNTSLEPHMLSNGLRTPCAEVELLGGEIVWLPAADLELTGR
ncbi:hypothetical protein G4Y79_03605 [Phototrophicus methaneseepsis]|uniref:KOW domain-containing protein n=1 Tax=Phototrophicus methaneseepsis TaxID=2710758 RepID=A0A7S8EAP9_9CHLR|nr:hypothetical protein [Phototrophicus methaneseepsis]QPC83480.1 hypothetical protein G4Y79_03605 [Phototrophicus methaneseepsis]